MTLSAASASTVIAAAGLTKSYGPRVGVRDVTLEVPAGCVFGFLGPNGAGKTTAIRLLLGFLQPDSGTARVFGRDCWRESHVIKRDVGYLPGDLRLYGWMNGVDALKIVGKARRIDISPRGRELADYFALDLSVRVRNMSRGMRQKLGLILTLAHDPKLLVLDEPTSALDPITQDRLYEHLRSLASAGHTIFFSSHVLSEVENLCHRVAIVRAGELIADESLESLRGRAKRSVVIRWNGQRAPARAEAPPSLTVHDADDTTWRGSLNGDIAGLIAWLNGQPVADLSISPPDLDSLFRSYYRQERGA